MKRAGSSYLVIRRQPKREHEWSETVCQQVASKRVADRIATEQNKKAQGTSVVYRVEKWA